MSEQKVINIKDIRNGVVNETFRKLIVTDNEAMLGRIERLYRGDITEGRQAICMAVNLTLSLGYSVQLEPGLYLHPGDTVKPESFTALPIDKRK